MSSLFHQIPDAFIVLCAKGVYRQAPVFVRENRLYAKWGSGFIGLREHANGTTLPYVRWEHIEGVGWATEGLGVLVQADNKIRRVV